MQWLLLITLALPLAGCHVLFSFDVSAPTPLEDGGPADGPLGDGRPQDGPRGDGPRRDGRTDLKVLPDGLVGDAPVKDGAALDQHPPPLDAKPPKDQLPPPDSAPTLGWSTMSSGVNVAIYDVWGHSSSSVFAVGSAGTVLHYGGVGTSWKKLTAVTTKQLWSVSGAMAPGEVIAAGDGGTVVRCNASACALLPVSYVGPAPALTGVSCVSASSCFFSGYNSTTLQGEIYELTPGNKMTQVHSVTSTGQLFGLWTWSSPLRVHAVGHGGTLVRFDGAAFAETQPFPTANLKEVWGVGADDLFAVGLPATVTGYSKEATLLRRAGGTWSKISPTKTTAALYGVWASSKSDAYAVGSGGTILRYNGTMVTALPAGQTGAGSAYLWAVWGASASDVFVAGNGGLILRYH